MSLKEEAKEEEEVITSKGGKGCWREGTMCPGQSAPA